MSSMLQYFTVLYDNGKGNMKVKMMNDVGQQLGGPFPKWEYE